MKLRTRRRTPVESINALRRRKALRFLVREWAPHDLPQAEFLMSYVRGELPAAARARFDGHLAECPSCVAYLSTYE